MKLWFQVMETRVSSVWNQSFCTSLIMVDLFISNSCYVLTRNITNPGSCLLYYP